MSNEKLRKPKSKRFRRYPPSTCLPFEVTEHKDAKEYIKPTHLIGNLTTKGVVEIVDEQNAKYLYEKGYFGKGSLLKNTSEFESEKDIESWDQEEPETASSSTDQPFKILQLMFEEAFFLSYGLGCLIVKEKDIALTILDLWQRFCQLTTDGRFPYKYACYHHFRSKNWIVKSGLKYGVDYVLYKDGPSFYHSTYAVIVKDLSQNLTESSMSWSELSALTRVNEHVAKDVLFCYVVNVSDADLSNPSCINCFKIQETVLQRWVASEERKDL